MRLNHWLLSCSTPPETVWMFDAALTFWAMLKLGTRLDSSSNSPNKTTITCQFYLPSRQTLLNKYRVWIGRSIWLDSKRGTCLVSGNWRFIRTYCLKSFMRLYREVRKHAMGDIAAFQARLNESPQWRSSVATTLYILYSLIISAFWASSNLFALFSSHSVGAKLTVPQSFSQKRDFDTASSSLILELNFRRLSRCSCCTSNKTSSCAKMFVGGATNIRFYTSGLCWRLGWNIQPPPPTMKKRFKPLRCFTLRIPRSLCLSNHSLVG
jgi:hypothetical protein